MSNKVLITGLPNTGKTTLTKDLKNALVFARDDKLYSLAQPHYNVPDFTHISEMENIVGKKLDEYKERFKKSPETLVFDSVSRVQTDIEINCKEKFKNFDVWSNQDVQIKRFTKMISNLEIADYNIVLIAHAVWDADAGKYIETCKGAFAKVGGFLSTVDHAIYLEVLGNKRLAHFRNHNLSRTLLPDLPEKIDVNELNLQWYVEQIRAQSNDVEKKWAI